MKETDEKTSPRIAVAPMIDWTDRHCRFFHRLFSPHALLYTEMIAAQAAVHGNRDHLLGFSAAEHPVAIQFGGSDPDDLARASAIAEEKGYDEVNLNCGCPSEKVQKGRFGACLMAEPELVARLVRAMRGATSLPVTVKCRIGIDTVDELPFLRRFVEAVAGAGCRRFIIHARKAWMKGLSPKENRDIPPLRYDIAAQIKRDNPDLHIWLNGGVRTVSAVLDALETFDGVMIGREAYHNLFFLAQLDLALYGTPLPDRDSIARRMKLYAMEEGVRPHAVARHMAGLFHGERGARHWRQTLPAFMEGEEDSPRSASVL